MEFLEKISYIFSKAKIVFAMFLFPKTMFLKKVHCPVYCYRIHAVKVKSEKGFTLVEILVSTLIMALAVGAVMQVLHSVIQLNETNNNMTQCVNVAQGLMDEIRGVIYEDIISNYNGYTFTLNDLDSQSIPNQGLVIASEIEPGYLMRVKIVICWKQKNRIIGEAIPSGNSITLQDLDASGEIDSPCSVEAAIIYK
ncbi:MAG: type II secretion system protein [Candidatus Omnitrophica bacterium]|nr:type II secretion system protein [Candidatus Omnitrophota bacterium]